MCYGETADPDIYGEGPEHADLGDGEVTGPGGTHEEEEVEDKHEILDAAEAVAFYGRAPRRRLSVPLWEEAAAGWWLEGWRKGGSPLGY